MKRGRKSKGYITGQIYPEMWILRLFGQRDEFISDHELTERPLKEYADRTIANIRMERVSQWQWCTWGWEARIQRTPYTTFPFDRMRLLLTSKAPDLSKPTVPTPQFQSLPKGL